MLGCGAYAADHQFQILLDTDNNALTGCSVATSKGTVSGVEQVWTTIVTTTGVGATVTSIERQTCVGTILGAPKVFATAGWSAGLGNGTLGTAAIESYVPLSALPTKGSMKVEVASTNATGGQDATAPFVVVLGRAPPQQSGAQPIPLSRWLIFPLALLVLALAAWRREWRPEHVGVFVFVSLVAASGVAWAATVILDGNIGDWKGTASVAGNPKGSAPIDANIVGVFYQSDNTNLYFRIDADVRPDVAGNQAPVVSAGADQTITLPAIANLNGTASDDGLPNPPGALTLSWTVFSGPAAVTFGNAAAAVTTATFTLPGLYTLRLTANDGALTTSSDTHVTVNSLGGTGPKFLPIADQTIPLGARFQQVLAANSGNSGPLTYSLMAAPGGAALNPSPLVDWTPTAAQLGSNTFTAKVTDSASLAATTTFHVTVVFVDHPPQLAPQPDVTMITGTAFSRTLTATDPDAGDTLTFALVSAPPGMTLTGAVLNWSTTGTAPGIYPVTVKVTDGSGQSDTRTFVVTLTPTAPPVANDDSFEVILGNTLTVPAPGVLGNDLDADGLALSATKLTDPNKGTLNAFNADGSFTYQAPAVLPGPVFAPVIKYHIDGVVITDPPFVADVDGDGKPELIAVGAGGSVSQGITARRGTDGSLLWQTAALPAPASDCSLGLTGGGLYHLAVGDIDDSGQLSVVLPTTCGRDNLPTQIGGTVAARYVALNALDGSLKWLSPPLGHLRDATYGNPDSWAAGTVPTIARLRSGETPSILVGKDGTYFDFAGKPECEEFAPGWPALQPCRAVFVLDGTDGTVRQRMAALAAIGADGPLSGNGTSAAVAADLDGDGNVEIVYGGAVFNNDGSVRWNNNNANPNRQLTYWNGLGNFDDTPEIEIVRLDNDIDGFGGGPRRLAVFKSDGSLLWALPLPGSAYTGEPVVADVDGTGRPSVVLAVDGNICAVDYRGTYKWCYDAGAPGGVSNISFTSRVQVYDLDGDGIPEVIVSLNGEQLLFLDGKTGTVKTTLNMNTTNIPAYLDYGIGGPIVADLDGSGHASIVTLWGGVGKLDVVTAQNNDWRPARKIFNQESYQWGNVNDDGTIPKTFVNNFATPATNVFGTQAQVLTPVDPRLKTQTSFTYQASDSLQSSAPATVTIEILPTNRPPVFVSTPPTRYVANSPFSYAAHAVDPDPGDTVSYSLKFGQGSGASVFGNCTMAPSTGVLSCGILFSGEQDFIIVATDSFGASAYQNIQMLDSPGPGVVPDVVGQTQAAAKTTLTGAGFATGNITQIFNAAPAGQVIAQAPAAGTSALLGELVDLSVSQGPMPVIVPFLVGEPLSIASAQLAGLGFTVIVTLVPSATDPVGEVLGQSPAFGTMLPPTAANPVTLTVSSGPAPQLANLASVVVKPAATARLVGETVPFTASGIYNNGTSADFTLNVTWASTVPGVATVGVDGIAHAVGPGSTTITAKVGSFTGQATLNVAAFVPGDSVVPTALITAPAAGGTVTAPTQVVGTATDSNFLRYELAVAPAGDIAYTVIGGGIAPVVSGPLGTFDPTLLINGLYTLRLTVFDSGGNQSVATSTVQVSGNMKVGLFTLTYQDLAIPLSGIPITVSRTYDSRDKGQGDFGIGWRLGVQTLRISTNRVLGTGWVRTQAGAVITLNATDEHKVSLTLADGYVEEFDMQVSPTSNLGSLDATTVTGFVPRSGTLGQLQALANNSLLILNAGAEDELVDDTTLNTYDPQLFRYTAADGTQIDIHRTEGVKQVKDRNGNTLTFGPAGIIHSSGKSVVFTRDAQGRVTQITDPAGNVQSYAYDLNGDLVSHTDAVGNTSRYAYNGTHGLIDIQDPAGNHAARNDYDADGRLITATDANGNAITFTNDLAASREVVRDRLGNPTAYDYDAAGNVTTKTDALGKVTTYTYDSRNNQLTQTDPVGRVASKTYDSQNNVLTSTDIEGNTTVSTYNATGQVLTVVDPEGHTKTNVYDATGNLTQVTDPEGGVTKHVYDGAGNRLSTTDPLGKVTTFTYDASGNKTSETDPLGNATTFSHDANGRILVKTDAAGKAEQIVYDSAGRLTSAIDKLGNAGFLTYSAVGNGQKIASRTDAAGRVTLIDYDVLGNLTKTTYPDGTAAFVTYDAENHVLSKTDPDGHTTAFQYDALGRQTKTTYPDGTTTVTTYDAAGRIVTRTDERGKTTSYAYAPNQQTITDALGNANTQQFDSQGRRVKLADALNHVTSFAYDSAGDSVKTTFADGSFKTATFDAAKRKILETDQAGHSTQYAYDAAGRLTKVTDAAGGITSYTYDGVGNRLSQTDANGHTTQMSYDSLGHIVSRTRPSGKQEGFTYDSNGNQLSHTDFNGQATTFTYDAMNRLVQKNLPAVGAVAYAWTAAGLRTQAGGDSYAYDPRGRLLQEHKATGETLTYTYDAAGNKTSVTTSQGTTNYTYDALNHIATVVDAAGTTTYSYDAVGNLASTAYPNGVTATYGYDMLNRLLHLSNTGPGGTISSYSYTLGPIGNRVQVAEAGSATTGRTVAYTFDPVYRLVQEKITEPGPVIQTISYSYDALGNRVQMNRNGTTTTYTYDGSDRLVTEVSGAVTFTSSYDDNGNLVSRGNGAGTDFYVYDAENRLLSANTSSGVVSYTYDADGMRTSKTSGGVTTSYLLDKGKPPTSCGCKTDNDPALAQVLVETTGPSIATYTYGNGLIDQTQAGSGTHFYVADGQSSTRQLTNNVGSVTDTYTFDAFGVTLVSSGSTTNVYLYGGEQLDPNLGFYYLRARYYNQTTGRFLSTDPEEGSIFDPVSLHRYLYANANPVDNKDPSGRFSLPELTIVNAIYASLATGLFVTVGSLATGIATDLSTAVGYGALASATVFTVLAGGVFFVTAELETAQALIARASIRTFIQYVRIGGGPAAQTFLRNFVIRNLPYIVSLRCPFLRSVELLIPPLVAAGRTLPAISRTPGTQAIASETFLVANPALAEAAILQVQEVARSFGCY